MVTIMIGREKCNAHIKNQLSEECNQLKSIANRVLFPSSLLLLLLLILYAVHVAARATPIVVVRSLLQWSFTGAPPHLASWYLYTHGPNGMLALPSGASWRIELRPLPFLQTTREIALRSDTGTRSTEILVVSCR